MIIVSQDKSKIVNFDNVAEIETKGLDDSRIVCITNNDLCIPIGIYKSKERAKEVLQEIIKNYESKLLINFKGLLSNEHERMLMKKYNSLSENTNIFVSDERKDIQYIPCQKNVYYMPEE